MIIINKIQLDRIVVKPYFSIFINLAFLYAAQEAILLFFEKNS